MAALPPAPIPPCRPPTPNLLSYFTNTPRMRKSPFVPNSERMLRQLSQQALRKWPAPPRPRDQTDDEQHQEHDEQHLGDPHRQTFEAPETEKSGHQRHQQKNQCPSQHNASPQISFFIATTSDGLS